MKSLTGLGILLALQSLGELLSKGFHLPFPGPVVGMLLLLVALPWPSIREPVIACAQFLLSHLSLLFIPVGVGVMTHLDLVAHYGVRIFIAVVLSTAIGLAVTALTLRWLIASKAVDQGAPDA